VTLLLASERRDSAQRPAHEAEAEDVVKMLDVKSQLESVTSIAATDMSRPEESNMCSVAAHQPQLEATVERSFLQLWKNH